jgi:hypothetical protein
LVFNSSTYLFVYRHDLAQKSIAQSLSFDETHAAAMKSKSIQSFNNLIDWQEPDGLTMLTFERLVKMTLQRAYLEAKGELD